MNSEYRTSAGVWVDVVESRRVPLTAYLLDFREFELGVFSSPSYSPPNTPVPDTDSE
jgi:hypothetical protein